MFYVSSTYTSEVRKSFTETYALREDFTGHALHTHTRTQASSYAHSDRPIQYFQIQELSISSFSLNLLFFLDPVFSYSAPNGHSPFSRG